MAESKTIKATLKKTTAQKTKKVDIIEEKSVDFPVRKQEDDPTLLTKRKILFVASEARPFIATGGLADVIGSLPQSLAQDAEYDIRVVLPLYSDIKPEHRRKMAYLGNIYGRRLSTKSRTV